MGTLRTVMNFVLTSIGEDPVDAVTTTLSSTYHLQLLAFINTIKEEIEDAHNWRDLVQTHTLTINSGNSAVITNANERSRLMRVPTGEGSLPMVFDVTQATYPYPLTEMSISEAAYNQTIDPVTTNATPGDFAIVGNGNGTLSLTVYPKVASARNYAVTMFTPQARLTVNDLDTTIKIPARPVELGATWYALQERGEELGASSLFTEERYRNSIDDAIARDSDEQGGYTLQVT